MIDFQNIFSKERLPSFYESLSLAEVYDLGGTLMNESITRAAGTIHGQEMTPVKMEGLIKSINRIPQERSTLYGLPLSSQRSISKTSFWL